MKLKEVLSWLTFSGVDDHAPWTHVQELLENPDVELAFLYHKERQGAEARYPELGWIETRAREWRKAGRMALHVCGRAARDELYHGGLDGVLERFGRVQLNGQVRNLEKVHELMTRFSQTIFITQHIHGNEGLVDALRMPNHAVLVRQVGEAQEPPAKWALPHTSKHLGVAGNLAPENLAVHICQVATQVPGLLWIDLATHVRGGGGRFCVERAKECLEIKRGLDDLQVR